MEFCFYHPVGSHSGESLLEIIDRKMEDISKYGFTLWSFSKVGEDRLNLWKRCLKENNQEISDVICCGENSKDPLINGEPYWVKEYSEDLINWENVPEKMTSYQKFPKGGNPVASAFFASLIYSGTNALFSGKKVSDLYDPTIKIKKSSLDKHHIFPKEYLKTKNFELTLINQIANLTYLEYVDNIKISDSAPKNYYTAIKENYYVGKEIELEKSLDKHGIPRNFYEMDYKDFLIERRRNISKIIKDHYELMN